MTQWPCFDSDYFATRYNTWNSRRSEFYDENNKLIPTKKLTPKQQAFKRKYYWPDPPIDMGLSEIRFVLFPTCMHSMGAAGMILFMLFSKLVDTSHPAYHNFTNNLKRMNNYLENGNIVGSTSTLLNVIHQLSMCFILILILFI